MRILSRFLAFCFCIGIASSLHGQVEDNVKIWEEPLTLPTYMLGEDEVNPMFFKNDSYQGASRVIYPYPLQDNFTNNKQDKDYKALYLENKYIKLCILPEFGGRLFYATDKTNDYEIFYRQHVIKPGHIGMLGAWISGGIEWCVFHHHRASTSMMMDYDLVENEDGSKTIWFGEIEPRHRMKWSIGVTLHPASSVIDVDVRMFNRTDNTNTILYWANVATHVNEEYQVIFPESVDFATFHAKNSFSHWPITQEPYNGYEYYAEGIDASWWKNHPNQVSFFAHNLREGFLAGYDHGKDAGTLHVANHHIVAGAKLWEWGPGPRGSFWDTQVLTDEDGSYAELMTGAFSDNQPDYSWIKPYEVKHFKQSWSPIRKIKGVKKANINASVNLELENNLAWLGFNTTRMFKDATVQLKLGSDIIHAEKISIDPAKPYTKEIKVAAGTLAAQLEAVLMDKSGNEIVSYQPIVKEIKTELPPEVNPPTPPGEIKTIEELYLTGLRIKQFHNARLDPMNYFLEALKRDPKDIRTNIQVGLHYQSKWMDELAASYFRQAISRLTDSYTRPRNCEALYRLGTILKRQGKLHDAYDTLYRATWDQSFHAAAYLQISEISSIWGDYANALAQVEKALATNALSTSMLNLKSSILRKLNRIEEADQVIKKIISIDPLDHRSRFESILIAEAGGKDKSDALHGFTKLLRDAPESYLELAAEYMGGGFMEEAMAVLELAASSDHSKLKNYPTIYYYIGHLHVLEGQEEKAKTAFATAESLSTDYCFPYRSESIAIYQKAIELLDQPSRAHYYLGNLLYDKQPDLAMEHWQKAVEIDDDLAIAYRNLGWGYNLHKRELVKAIESYEQAVAHDPTQPRYYYELDLLYEAANTDVQQRLEILEKNHQYVEKRENALAREIRVLILNEQYDKAIDYLEKSDFHAQEGTRDLHDTYVEAQLLRGAAELRKGAKEAALSDFLAADEYPENHQIGLDPNYELNSQIYYYIGIGYKNLGKKKQAKEYFNKAVSERNHNSTDGFYKAMAWQQLGNKTKKEEYLKQILQMSEELFSEEEQVDFFSKFGGMTAPNQRKASGYFAKGLYELGQGNTEAATQAFRKSLEIDVNQLWAKEYLKTLVI